MDDDELDLGEAAAFILGERPSLAEDDVWTILKELHPDLQARAADMTVALTTARDILLGKGSTARR